MLYTIARYVWKVAKWLAGLIILFFVAYAANVAVVQEKDVPSTFLIVTVNWLFLPGIHQTLTVSFLTLFFLITLFAGILVVVGKQIEEQFTHPLIGQQLLLHHVDRKSFQGEAILHRSLHLRRERSQNDLLAGGTALALCLLFDDDQPLAGQLDHLAAFHLQHVCATQVVLTGGATFHAMGDHRIWLLHQSHHLPGMSWLASYFLAALFSQTLGLSLKVVRRRRQMAIVTVFRQSGVQLFHLCGEHGDLLGLSLDQVLLAPHLLVQGAILLAQYMLFFRCQASLLGLLNSYKEIFNELSEVNHKRQEGAAGL